MATTDKLNEKILQKAEDELSEEVSKFIAILNSKADYSQYERVDIGDAKNVGLGNINSFKYTLQRMVKAGYLKSLHNKKVNTVLKQFEI
mgnify:CR=1 FL=1|tara:strand:- start:1283 stop:1549 length:267 start_codon:yes stop_codon:yes gene_type:complete